MTPSADPTKTAPPVPAGCDLRDLQWMPLDVGRLRDSDLAASSGEVFRVAVLSWCAAWHQVPAASLPDDDAILARLLGFGRDVKAWAKVRAAGGLRGWKLHADGRLYHPVVAQKALEALEQKRRAQTKRDKDAERLRNWRKQQDETGGTTSNETRVGNDSETHLETRFVAERQDRTVPYQTLPKNNTTPPPPPGVSPRERASDAGAVAPTPPGGGGGARQKISGVRGLDVNHAVQAGDTIGVVKAFGVTLTTENKSEWIRDSAGMQLGKLVAILWQAMRDRRPVRQPSGLRKARAEFEAIPLPEQRQIALAALVDLGIQVPPQADQGAA